jgi:signal transduction histidine kinase
MAAADEVAAGDLSVRVDEGGPGEIGRLATAFNHMVAELERSDRLRRDLTADVAHELRTPLHILQGNLEAIQDGVYTPTPEQIELLLDETRQLARLVEDLRTLSLAEAGQLELVKAPVQPSELIQDALTSFSAPAEAAGVRLLAEIEPAAADATIQGDAGRLDQVLGNLIANALRHSPPGKAVTVRLGLAAAGRLRLQVCDQGEGIPPEDLPYVFDRFWRGRRDDSQSSGSGLGLAIARRLVQAHGGTIHVESTPGHGATFTIEL